MLRQAFAEVSFEPYGKTTRRERFLDEMKRDVMDCFHGKTLGDP